MVTMSSNDKAVHNSIHVVISFRGATTVFDLCPDSNISLADVQAQIISNYTERTKLQIETTEFGESIFPSNPAEATTTTTTEDSDFFLNPSDIKIMFKGQVLSDYTTPMYQILTSPSSVQKHPTTTKVVRLVATGQSTRERYKDHLISQQALQSHHHRLIRDDLTENGLKQLQQNRIQGRKLLVSNQQKQHQIQTCSSKYGFQTIKTLPNLPQQSTAKEILTSLSQDPGILACMTKNKWTVGCLSEMYPEGKVGESEVCILGLNRNKGMEILLRLRTDDLQGFRKMQTIRKVLYHELAHNVYSEHDGNFFLLMRQIEKECIEMNWTMNSRGQTLMNDLGPGGERRRMLTEEEEKVDVAFHGGVYRLGSGTHNNNDSGNDGWSKHPVMSTIPKAPSSRELRAQAALNRLELAEKDSNKKEEERQFIFCTICQCDHPGSYHMDTKCNPSS